MTNYILRILVGIAVVLLIIYLLARRTRKNREGGDEREAEDNKPKQKEKKPASGTSDNKPAWLGKNKKKFQPLIAILGILVLLWMFFPEWIWNSWRGHLLHLFILIALILVGIWMLPTEKKEKSPLVVKLFLLGCVIAIAYYMDGGKLVELAIAEHKASREPTTKRETYIVIAPVGTWSGRIRTHDGVCYEIPGPITIMDMNGNKTEMDAHSKDATGQTEYVRLQSRDRVPYEVKIKPLGTCSQNHQVP